MLIIMRHLSRASRILSALLAAASCGDGASAPSTSTRAASIALVEGAAITGRVGDSVRVAVRVAAASGQPAAGQSVTFIPASPGATVTAPTALTDATGVASTIWVFGTTTGAQLLSVRVGDLAPLSVNAAVAAGRPTTLTIVAGDVQTAAVATAVAVRPAVVVRDASGNTVTGARVVFTADGGDRGARVRGDTATSDSAGVATVGAWEVGRTIGEYTLHARFAAPQTATPSAQFTATARAGPAVRLTIVTSPPDSALVGTSVPEESLPAVRVADAYGNPIAGAEVQFAVAAGRATFPATAPITDATGRAGLSWLTIGTLAGPVRLTASVTSAAASVASVGFTTIALPERASFINMVSGFDQVAGRGEVLTAPLVVRVVDRHGNPVPAVQVTFFAFYVSQRALVDTTPRTSDADGLARSGTITMPSEGAGTLSVNFRAPGVGATGFEFRVRPGPPHKIVWSDLEIFGYPPVTVTAHGTSGGLTADVVDELGIKLAGVPVLFSVNPPSAGTVFTGGPPSVPLISSADVPMTVRFAANGSMWGWVHVVATTPGVPPAKLRIWVQPPQ